MRDAVEHITNTVIALAGFAVVGWTVMHTHSCVVESVAACEKVCGSAGVREAGTVCECNTAKAGP